VRNDDRAAVTKLHALLDAEQRGAFVDALETQMKAKHGAAAAAMPGMMKMKTLADALKLTDEQKSQIHGLMRDAMKEGWAKHHEAGQQAGPRGEGQIGRLNGKHH